MMRAVVFDMDGLMFNTEDIYTIVGATVLQRRGYEFTMDLKKSMMGMQPRPSFEMMIKRFNLPETWQALMAESNELFLGLLEKHLKPMPGLLTLLGALEPAGIPKAIGTSSPRKLVFACLDQLHLKDRFEFILTAEDIAHGKPDPEIYLTAAKRFDIAPAEMAVFEDSENGCKAASAAGAFTIAVPSEHSRTHDFSMASLIAKSLADPQIYRTLGIPN